MASQKRPAGKTTIAPDVLISIAKLTTLSVPGVSKIAPSPREVSNWFRPGYTEGVIITVENDTVFADLYVVLLQDVNIREVCHTIQSKVSRAISESVGMEVGRVNVHVEDISYSDASA
jgi:uncharacterized alkaline shock family protein YloU